MSEQKHYYTDEKNAQIVIALEKAVGPGSSSRTCTL